MPSDERRHEVTVLGVTAYASPWTKTGVGDAICTVSSKGRATMDVTLSRIGGTVLLSYDALFPAEALVLAAVLQEAAAKAQGDAS